MSKQLELSWSTGTPQPRVRLPIGGPWSKPPVDVEETTFFRSWLVYDSALDSEKSPHAINWDRVWGLVVVTTISASFWSGIGLLASRFWK